MRIAAISFRNFKAFKSFNVSLGAFNVLVGPNNAGKSTIVVALRMLAEGLRKANAKSAELVRIENRTVYGYRIALEGLPVASENVFHNYDASEPASVTFKLTHGKALVLWFPEQGECILRCETNQATPRTPSQFKGQFPLRIGLVPILGPVESDEPLYQEEAARLALITHRASRNFRNIWHHYPEQFQEFRLLVQQTWPGMDILRPEVQMEDTKAHLRMFCPEERLPREIYWSGYGFQVWCQMLTFIVKAKDASTIVIDEPDIYLHSDLQRQLVALLRTLGPDVLIATHSTEIISESEPGELIAINKKWRSARLIKNSEQIQNLFATLGSGLNPVLTQLAKTRRVLFVEGKDFQLLAAFARRLGNDLVANRRDFAVIPVEGFNPKKVLDLSEGIEATLGGKILKGVVLDRDFRPDAEVASIFADLERTCDVVAIHDRKEIENFILHPDAIARAIDARLKDRASREGIAPVVRQESGGALLDAVANTMKAEVLGQYMARWADFERKSGTGTDLATINAAAVRIFDARWEDSESRQQLLPGKLVVSKLNAVLQERYKISISPLQVAALMRVTEIPESMAQLVAAIGSLCKNTSAEIVEH